MKNTVILMKRVLLPVLLVFVYVSLSAQNIELQKPKQAQQKKVFDKVEKMPEYPGGMDALNKYMLETVKYPEKAKKDKIMGTVNVRFIVNADGTVSDVEAVRKIGGGCDEEAVRVVSSMPKWSPGQEKGKNVPVYMILPVKFLLH